MYLSLFNSFHEWSWDDLLHYIWECRNLEEFKILNAHENFWNLVESSIRSIVHFQPSPHTIHTGRRNRIFVCRYPERDRRRPEILKVKTLKLHFNLYQHLIKSKSWLPNKTTWAKRFRWISSLIEELFIFCYCYSLRCLWITIGWICPNPVTYLGWARWRAFSTVYLLVFPYCRKFKNGAFSRETFYLPFMASGTSSLAHLFLTEISRKVKHVELLEHGGHSVEKKIFLQ